MPRRPAALLVELVVQVPRTTPSAPATATPAELGGKLGATDAADAARVGRWVSVPIPLPGRSAQGALQAVDEALAMGASMGGKLPQGPANAHDKALGGVGDGVMATAAGYDVANTTRAVQGRSGINDHISSVRCPLLFYDDGDDADAVAYADDGPLLFADGGVARDACCSLHAELMMLLVGWLLAAVVPAADADDAKSACKLLAAVVFATAVVVAVKSDSAVAIAPTGGGGADAAAASAAAAAGVAVAVDDGCRLLAGLWLADGRYLLMMEVGCWLMADG